MLRPKATDDGANIFIYAVGSRSMWMYSFGIHSWSCQQSCAEVFPCQSHTPSLGIFLTTWHFVLQPRQLFVLESCKWVQFTTVVDKRSIFITLSLSFTWTLLSIGTMTCLWFDTILCRCYRSLDLAIKIFNFDLQRTALASIWKLDCKSNTSDVIIILYSIHGNSTLPQMKKTALYIYYHKMNYLSTRFELINALSATWKAKAHFTDFKPTKRCSLDFLGQGVYPGRHASWCGKVDELLPWQLLCSRARFLARSEPPFFCLAVVKIPHPLACHKADTCLSHGGSQIVLLKRTRKLRPLIFGSSP